MSEGCEGVFEGGLSVSVVIFARGSFWLSKSPGAWFLFSRGLYSAF